MALQSGEFHKRLASLFSVFLDTIHLVNGIKTRETRSARHRISHVVCNSMCPKRANGGNDSIPSLGKCSPDPHCVFGQTNRKLRAFQLWNELARRFVLVDRVPIGFHRDITLSREHVFNSGLARYPGLFTFALYLLGNRSRELCDNITHPNPTTCARQYLRTLEMAYNSRMSMVPSGQQQNRSRKKEEESDAFMRLV